MCYVADECILFFIFCKGARSICRMQGPSLSHSSFPAWDIPSRRSYSQIKRERPHASPFAGQQSLYHQLAYSRVTPWLSGLLAQAQGLLLSRSLAVTFLIASASGCHSTTFSEGCHCENIIMKILCQAQQLL